jgi:RNA polymerase primary sigma factor
MTGLAPDAEVDDWLRTPVARPPARQFSAPETPGLPESVAIRARRLLGARITFVGHPSFDDATAVAWILGPMPEPDGSEASRPEEARRGSHPPGPQCGGSRLLTREQEVHLFRKMNFLKYAAARLREAIDPHAAVAAEVDRVEVLLREATAILDRIVGSNLALVLSIAKKHARLRADFADLVSDGNLSLLRAAERFDFARGFRFSTYATWAIINGFVRQTRREAVRHARFVTCRPEFIQSVADQRGGESPEVTRWETSNEVIRSLLDHLNDREQTIIDGRFGLSDKPQTLLELASELGISKERVRQIETRALRKLWDTDEARRLARAAWGT